MRRYFKKDENDCHIYHYIKHCSQGDWLVLYQMSRNMNKRSVINHIIFYGYAIHLKFLNGNVMFRFYTDFLSVLSRTVNPHQVCRELSLKIICVFANQSVSDQGRECHELEKDTFAKHSNGDILDTDDEAERDQVK